MLQLDLSRVPCGAATQPRWPNQFGGMKADDAKLTQEDTTTTT